MAVIPTTKTLLLKIFVNITRILMLWLDPLGTSLNTFGILIFLLLTPFWLQNTSFLLDDQPYSFLFKIYKKEFLDLSEQKQLIHSKQLTLASNGTPVVTSHRERKKRICNCTNNGIYDCKCDLLCFKA